jgi:hypothetical protein
MAFRHAKMVVEHFGILRKLIRATVKYKTARRDDIDLVGDRKRKSEVLLNEQNCVTLAAEAQSKALA